MADMEEIDELLDEDDESSGGLFSNKKMLIIIILGVLVLVGGGVGAAGYFLGWFAEEEGEAAVVEEVKPAFFFELPEMTVNLSSSEVRARYLKVKIALEFDSEETIELLKPNLPRVMDAFQVYLRELRVSDLRGSAGMFRLKQELQRRVNLAIEPARVNAVLFREIIIQ